MAQVEVHTPFEMDEPTLVEGLPGAGLVGKIATDHLVETLDMEWVAACHCDGLPKVAVYRAGSATTMPPVRVYADEAHDLLALQADVPVSPTQAADFTDCVTAWLESEGVFPVYLSGLPEEKDGVPGVYGIATGDGGARLEAAGIDPPAESGFVSGPTGALVHTANARGLDGAGLVVETEARFPDPEAARALLVDGVEPLVGIDVDTDALVEHAEEIRKARERLARQVQEGGDDSTEATAIRGFQ
jgi:uncharacterized protein